MTRLLEDKVVVVSGIGPGLGVHLATQAAEAGARLVIAARTAEKLDSAERDIATLAPGTQVLKVPTDIAQRAQCKCFSKIPLGLIPPDSECARSIIYLASDMASVVTGAALDVNGGEYLPR